MIVELCERLASVHFKVKNSLMLYRFYIQCIVTLKLFYYQK